MIGALYKTKKALKESIGLPLAHEETSMFGPEFNPNGKFCVVGPCAHTNRKWWATVTMHHGLIVKVS